MSENVQTWECGRENASDVIATLKDHTLIISGEGSMRNYDPTDEDWPSLPPWYEESITEIIINEGIKNIGSYAFYNRQGIYSITIPESVTTIGIGAFKGCTGLKEIVNRNPSPQLLDGKKGLNPHWKKIKKLDEMISAHQCSIGGGRDTNCEKIKLMEKQKEGYKNAYCYEDFSPFRNYLSKSSPNSRYEMILYVPSSSLAAYKRASVWSRFKSIQPFSEVKLPVPDDTSDSLSEEEIDEQISAKQQEIKKLEQEIQSLEFRKIMRLGAEGNPKHVAQFMSLFNQREGLKYLTHEFDESGEFDRDSFLMQFQKICTENFAQLDIPKTLKDLLNQFAFENNPKWLAFDNQFNAKENTSGWSAFEWEDNKLHPIKHTGFAEIIKDFKRTTRIESPNLETLINKVFADETFEIETNDLSKADFYTHVGEFKSALETIFEEIQKRSDTPDKKKVSVEYKKRYCDEYAVREIIISHHNSFPTNGDEASLIKEWLSLDKGSMGKIANHLQGYCHWSVVTKINDKPMRINIMREQDTPTQEEVDASEATGFTHILTFYHQS